MARRIAGPAFLLVAIVLGALAVSRQWTDVRDALSRLDGPALAVSAVAACAGLFATFLAWRTVLAALGSPLRMGMAAQIFFVGQLGKYLPGSLWPVVAQMELGQKADVPRARSATTFAVALLTGLSSGIFVAAMTVPLLGSGPYRSVLLVGPFTLLVLHPRVLNRVIAWFLRITRRPALERPLDARAVALAFGWSLCGWLVWGVHVWALATGLGADTSDTVALSLGGFALAWSAGLLVVIAPAGVGVREAVLVAALSPVLDSADALVVALASRLFMSVGDFVLAAASAWLGRLR